MADRLKGLYIKQSYPNDFVNLLEDLYKKYGEEIFSIQGIANKHMDVVKFSKEFFSKSNNSVADISVDANANVKEKNIIQYRYEFSKALRKLNSIYLLYKWVKKCFGIDDAKQAIESIINGSIFINDLTNIDIPYCFSFDLRNLLIDGMAFFKGNMNIKPPNKSGSFISLVIQTTAYISNQIAGASAHISFFPILNFFYEKEFGKDYIKNLKNSEHWYTIKNQFQNLIYSLNFPFRGSEAAFTNLSIMDKGFLKSLFNGYKLPDGDNFVDIDIDNTCELSKLFFEYYTDINSKDGIFTFPVMTLAISLDENNNYLDPDFVDWVAKANCEKALGNIFQSTPTAFSSCCRMLSNVNKINDLGYQNSFGVAGISTGSIRVAGLNMPRMAIEEKTNPDILNEHLDLLHKILYSHRQLIKHIIGTGNLPLYDTNWMDINRQYSTIGFIGAYEYVVNKGFNITSKEGVDCLTKTLKQIETKIIDWQNAEIKEKNIYNVEQIPGESMSVRLADIDKILGYNDKFELYSNQYIPLIDDASIFDRLKIQGYMDKHTTGGAICHINIDDEKPISAQLFKKLIVTAKDSGTVYFAINYAFSECENSHYSVGKHDKCPICDKNIICQYTRVVGFLTPVKSWNKVRKNYEYDRRVFYKNSDLEKNIK